MIITYIGILYAMFTNADNNFWGVVFISMPIGVMFVGLPLVVLFRDDEDLAMTMIIIGMIIFIFGLCAAGFVI